MAAPKKPVSPEWWNAVFQVPRADEFAMFLASPEYKDCRAGKELFRAFDAMVMAGVYIECDDRWLINTNQRTLLKIASRNFGSNPKPKKEPDWNNTESMWMADLRTETAKLHLPIEQLRRMNRREHLRLQNRPSPPPSPVRPDHDSTFEDQLREVTARVLVKSDGRAEPKPGPNQSPEDPDPTTPELTQRATRNSRDNLSSSTRHRTRSAASFPEPVVESSEVDIHDDAHQQQLSRESKSVLESDVDTQLDRMDVEESSTPLNSPGRHSRHRATSGSVSSRSPSRRSKSKSRSRSVSKVSFDQPEPGIVPDTGELAEEFKQIKIVLKTATTSVKSLMAHLGGLEEGVERMDRRSRTPTPCPVVPGAARVTRAARDNWMVGGKHLGVWQRPEDGNKLEALITSFES